MQPNARRRPAPQYKEPFFNRDRVQFLLFYILPFIVINLIIFFVVTAKPGYQIDIGETKDYRTTDVTFTITSHMPLKNVTISLDGDPLDLTKAGKRSYISTVTHNGVLEVHMENFNGMSITGYEVVDILDNELPDVTSYNVADNRITLWLNDTQSGIDYENLSAVTGDGRTIQPVSVDRSAGTAVFDIDATGLTVTIRDMSGNEYQPSFSVTEIVQDADNTSTLPAQ